MSSKKIHLIHHGFLLEKFSNVSEFDINKLKEKYILPNAQPVIGVISRYLELKGIQYIIPAFEKLLKEYPNALLVLANSSGNYKIKILKLLETIPKENYVEIKFESDLFSLYKLFDIFVHVPISKEIEAFGQTYVEALAASIPSIFTLSGVASEFINDKKNAIIVPYKNSEKIYEALNELIINKKLKDKIIQQGKEDVSTLFNIDKTIQKIEYLYLS